jgi:PAS domain S-box-containing protein
MVRKSKKHRMIKRSIKKTPSMTLEVDRALKFVAASPSYCSMVGKSFSKLKGQPLDFAHPGAIPSKLAELFENLGKNSRWPPQCFEDYNIFLKRWLSYKVLSHARGFTIVVTDITKDKSQELMDVREEENVRFIFEQAPVGMGRISLDGRWLAMNPRCATIIGVDKTRLIGTSYSAICLPEDILEEQKAFAKLVRREKAEICFEKQILRADQHIVWAQAKISLIYDSYGQPQFFTLVLEDIAERKENSDSLQFALNAAQMGTWDFDAIHNTTRRSYRFDEIFGYENPRLEWTYQDFLNHTHSEDSDKMKLAFQQALQSGQNLNLEYRILQTTTKEVRWISLKGRVYLNHHGRAVQMAGTVMDITGQKDWEETLKKAQREAESANREKSNFLANMSHEIRTPLGAILGFTDMLMDPSLKKEDFSEYLKIVLRNCKSLAVLVDDILDLSKVESGHLDVEEIPVEIWELMENVETLFRLRAESKGLKLKISSSGNIHPHLKTDPTRLRQILLNIVGNAIKFTSHGEVAVNLQMKATPKGSVLAFLVKDTGPGISAEQAKHLFQPFTQADSSTTRKFGGTGLGLALSRRLALALGGDVTLEKSQPGVGSEFLITVAVQEILSPALTAVDTPTQPEPADPKVPFQNGGRDCISANSPGMPTNPVAAGDSQRSSLANPLNGLQILVADDSPDNRLLISRILKKGGARIDLADDGNVALEKARVNSYDVVVMDMQMPNLDGYSATRQLRDEGFDGPIVALTANAMRNDRARCLEAGCSEYLPKPIDPVQLYRILGNLTQTIRH